MINIKNTLYKQVVLVFLTTLLWSSSVLAVTQSKLDRQRDIYVQASQALDQHDMETFWTLRKEIVDYPLTPYLNNRIFLSQLSQKNLSQVQNYLKKYDDFPFTTHVFNRYLAQLGAQKAWSEFLVLQPTVPRSEVYQCYFYRAQLAQGRKTIAWQGAKKLWHSGQSVNAACDPLFASWIEAKQRTDGDILDRMLLAFSAYNSSLLNYLKTQLSDKSISQGQMILDLYADPDGVEKFAKQRKVTSFYQSLTRVAFKRLSRKLPLEAQKQFLGVVKGQHFTGAEIQKLGDYLARHLLYTSDKKAQQWRDKIIIKSNNTALIEKRIEREIKNQHWTQVVKWIAILKAEAQKQPRWVFWKAHIADMQGKKKIAHQLYTRILGERDFYSVAAAIELNAPIKFRVQSALPKGDIKLGTYQNIFARIQELLILDKLDAARYEWQHMLNECSPQEIPMFAAYADHRGWHHFGILATVKGKMWDHLNLRFPLAYQWAFNFFSKEHQIAKTTLMAIARQESALFPNAHSRVGARGLMQLMPKTAQQTAQKLGYTSYSIELLYNSKVNIRLGSAYLKEMLDKYNQNRILAFASYNAGPNRVESWLQRSNGKLDVYAFIDMIPFSETRGYVKNALMFDLYYQKILGKTPYLLTKDELKQKY